MRLISVKDFRLLTQKLVTADDEIIGRIIEMVSDRIERFVRPEDGQLTYGTFDELHAHVNRNFLYVKNPPVDLTKPVSLLVNTVLYDPAKFTFEKNGRVTLVYGSWFLNVVVAPPGMWGDFVNNDYPYVEVKYSGGFKPQPIGVSKIKVTSGGSLYTSPPTVVITDLSGQGSGAAATATLALGVVSGVTVTNPGSGYQTPPVISFTGGGGSGAAADAELINIPLANQALQVPEILQRACFLQSHYEYLTRFGMMKEQAMSGKPMMLLDPNMQRTETGTGFLPEVEAALLSFRGRIFV